MTTMTTSRSKKPLTNCLDMSGVTIDESDDIVEPTTTTTTAKLGNGDKSDSVIVEIEDDQVRNVSKLNPLPPPPHRSKHKQLQQSQQQQQQPQQQQQQHHHHHHQKQLPGTNPFESTSITSTAGVTGTSATTTTTSNAIQDSTSKNNDEDQQKNNQDSSTTPNSTLPRVVRA